MKELPSDGQGAEIQFDETDIMKMGGLYESLFNAAPPEQYMNQLINVTVPTPEVLGSSSRIDLSYQYTPHGGIIHAYIGYSETVDVELIKHKGAGLILATHQAGKAQTEYLLLKLFNDPWSVVSVVDLANISGPRPVLASIRFQNAGSEKEAIHGFQRLIQIGELAGKVREELPFTQVQ